jgi:hypothetical protein
VNVTLPSTLNNINTYAFNECALVNINIPVNVNYIGTGAFKNISSSLLTVTFDKDTDIDNLLPDPKDSTKNTGIKSDAFSGSTVHFNVPWSQSEHDEKLKTLGNKYWNGWGASQATFTFAGEYYGSLK